MGPIVGSTKNHKSPAFSGLAEYFLATPKEPQSIASTIANHHNAHIEDRSRRRRNLVVQQLIQHLLTRLSGFTDKMLASQPCWWCASNEK